MHKYSYYVGQISLFIIFAVRVLLRVASGCKLIKRKYICSLSSIFFIGGIVYQVKFRMGLMEKTEIILIRHGESLGNAARLYLGRTDLDLSEYGYYQANEAAAAISDVKIDRIYSSPLIRAYNTAVPHARLRGLKITVVDDLAEIFLGEWENLPIEVLEGEWHEELVHGWRENFGVCKTPGGESVPEVAERVYNAVLKIAEANVGKTVLIASHAAAIRAFYGKVSGIAPIKLAEMLPFPLNASLTRVGFDGEKLYPIAYSDDSHIKSISPKS